jgi:hypothetical protein
MFAQKFVHCFQSKGFSWYCVDVTFCASNVLFSNIAKDTNFQIWRNWRKNGESIAKKMSLPLGTAADRVSWGAAMQCGLSVTIKLGIVCTQWAIVVGFSCCMSSWHHFKGSHCPRGIAQEEQLFLLNWLTLKMESLSSFKTSVTSSCHDTVLYIRVHECSAALLSEPALPYTNIYVVCLKSSVNGTRKQTKQKIQTN